ncbi:hypothetical protein I3843_16G020700 [Carya illinoinensis]|uniref:Uncharacterized protein n=1 Tax=Carya illinoinensis TaxID=32201 RepID=A0A8T1N508_CARIL|nr:hypothetical protein CIPAW_16G018900 [Carya illinoinensis]KAG6671710.1 hypothetical protein I3842_16G017400 [Carya illinoinensis]KAG7941089.1 hypothetical protein I3843_16G020700 [Carya illinoinensis]
MDMEQEDMQFLGIFGVYREAYKIILSWRRILSQITLAFVIPLAFIYLVHMDVSDLLFSRIIHNEIVLDETRDGTPKYNKLSDVVTSEWITFWLFKAAYFTFLLIFSLLSTSAVVYTIACIYTGREVTFKKVMSVVPKVWKRLMVTFICTFIAFFVYNIVAFLITIAIAITLLEFLASDKYFIPTFIAVGILYLVGFVYMTIVWQLASVVTVLEDSYGVRAMLKSKALLKGKMLVATVIFFKLNISLAIIQIAFRKLVVHGWRLGMASRLGYGIISLLLLFMLLLFGLVIQTVIYFVCKSYHHENIDKSTLSDHLEVYLGEYVPLKAKDVQLEQFDV